MDFQSFNDKILAFLDGIYIKLAIKNLLSKSTPFDTLSCESGIE